jgi:hypothetical protein
MCRCADGRRTWHEAGTGLGTARAVLSRLPIYAPRTGRRSCPDVRRHPPRLLFPRRRTAQPALRPVRDGAALAARGADRRLARRRALHDGPAVLAAAPEGVQLAQVGRPHDPRAVGAAAAVAARAPAAGAAAGHVAPAAGGLPREPHADVPAVLRGAADRAGPTARPWACRWRGSACCAARLRGGQTSPLPRPCCSRCTATAPSRWRASRCCTWRPCSSTTGSTATVF